jgi:hypothetical protein
VSDLAPLFDDTRKALVFALNAADVKMPKPSMTTAMAEGIKKKLPRTAKARAKFFAKAAEQREAERDALVRAAFKRKPTKLTGEERAAQAGFILLEFQKLDAAHQVVLTGLLTRSHSPCDCRRPCCSGWARNLRWDKAVADACFMLKETGDVLRQPGKRGLSTQPHLRKAVVEEFFTKRPITLVHLASVAHCSQMTAAKHKAWIVEYLEQTETEAWQQIAALFDAAGITGAFID